MGEFDRVEDTTSQMRAVPEQRTGPGKPCLLFLTGVDAGRLLALDGGAVKLVVGRDDSADIVVPSPEISRRHAEITRNAAGELEINDLGSMNGTFVNGNRRDRSLVRRGDKIRLGPHIGFKLVFQDDEDFKYASALFEQAHSDYLTGISNRRAILRQYEREWNYARRHSLPLSVAMIDIDRFKGINDKHGHLVGDQVLKGLVDRIQEMLRIEDALARYGGEEFLLIMRQTDRELAQAHCWELVEHVRKAGFDSNAGLIPLTVSIGVASAVGTDFELMVPKRLIHRADTCLYAAKKTGRDRVLSDLDQGKGGWSGRPDPTRTMM